MSIETLDKEPSKTPAKWLREQCRIRDARIAHLERCIRSEEAKVTALREQVEREAGVSMRLREELMTAELRVKASILDRFLDGRKTS